MFLKVSVSLSGGVSRPGGAVEMHVSGAPGAHVALLGQDANTVQAGLADDDGLGSGISMQMVIKTFII